MVKLTKIEIMFNHINNITTFTLFSDRASKYL